MSKRKNPGGPRKAVIVVPDARAVLVKLCRLMIHQHNTCDTREVGITREHIRNMARTHRYTHEYLKAAFVDALGASCNEIAEKIAEIFADDVLIPARPSPLDGAK